MKKLELAFLKPSRRIRGLGIGDLIPYALTFGVAVVILAVMALVLGGFQTSSSVQPVCSAGPFIAATGCTGTNTIISGSFATYNEIGQGLTGISNVASQFGLLGTVIGLGLVLAVVLGIFYFGGKKAEGAL